jgi:hypothetical protein
MGLCGFMSVQGKIRLLINHRSLLWCERAAPRAKYTRGCVAQYWGTSGAGFSDLASQDNKGVRTGINVAEPPLFYEAATPMLGSLVFC